jgi:hypothetical protein
MADFVLNAPGTTNNPWTPANVIIPSTAIISDSTGFRSLAAGDTSPFAHNVNYGSVITATVTVASGATSNGDDILVGSVVRTGANAGCIIGIDVGAFSVKAVTANASGVVTNISSGITITRANNDVWSCTVSIVAGTATINGNQNGGSNFSFSANTTTTFASEASLAAGAMFNAGNNNSFYLSQFTGTGVISTIGLPIMGSFIGAFQ